MLLIEVGECVNGRWVHRWEAKIGKNIDVGEEMFEGDAPDAAAAVAQASAAIREWVGKVEAERGEFEGLEAEHVTAIQGALMAMEQPDAVPVAEAMGAKPKRSRK